MEVLERHERRKGITIGILKTNIASCLLLNLHTLINPLKYTSIYLMALVV